MYVRTARHSSGLLGCTRGGGRLEKARTASPTSSPSVSNNIGASELRHKEQPLTRTSWPPPARRCAACTTPPSLLRSSSSLQHRSHRGPCGMNGPHPTTHTDGHTSNQVLSKSSKIAKKSALTVQSVSQGKMQQRGGLPSSPGVQADNDKRVGGTQLELGESPTQACDTGRA